MFNVMKRQVDAFSCALILNDAALSTKSRAHDSLIGYCVFVSIAFQSKLLSIHSGKLESEREREFLLLSNFAWWAYTLLKLDFVWVVSVS